MSLSTSQRALVAVEALPALKGRTIKQRIKTAATLVGVGAGIVTYLRWALKVAPDLIPLVASGAMTYQEAWNEAHMRRRRERTRRAA